MDKDTILDYVTETPGNTNRAVLRGMLNSIGGDSSLPEVTEDDNGKVLTVVEGAWDKANSGGGSGSVFVVNFAMDAQTMELTADKTYEEVLTAYNAMNNVVGVLSIGDDVPMHFPLVGGSSDGNVDEWLFDVNGLGTDGEGTITMLTYLSLRIRSNGTARFIQATKQF